jgi:hypothetical protein
MLRQVADNGFSLEPLCSGRAAAVLVVGQGWAAGAPVPSVHMDTEIIPVLDQVSPKAPEGRCRLFGRCATWRTLGRFRALIRWCCPFDLASCDG